VLSKLFKKEREIGITEGIDSSKFKDWELWEQKWSQKKVNRIWSEKVKNRVWQQDPAYKLVAESCAKYGHTVLDIGCGGGIQYAAIHEFYPEIDYTGVDITPKMLNAAHSLFPDVKFEWGDAAELQYANSQFDVTFLRHVLEHHPLSNGQKILHEALRVARNAVLTLFFIEPQDIKEDIIVKQKESGFYLNTYSTRWLEREISSATGEQYSIKTISIPKVEGSPALSDQFLWVIEKR